MSRLRIVAVAILIAWAAASVTFRFAQSRAAPELTGHGLGLPVDPLQASQLLATYKNVCTAEYRETFTAPQREEFDRAWLRMYNFELARLRHIDGSIGDTAARDRLDQYLASVNGQARAKMGQAGCASDQLKNLVRGHARLLLDRKASDHVVRVIEKGLPYDVPRAISSEAQAPRSFASPDLVSVVMSTQGQDPNCGSLSINSVELESKTVAPTINKPPYIRDVQNIAEVWTSTCDNTVRKRRLTFRQDDRKTWHYRIEAVN